MAESILSSTKKNLGIAADYTAFDADIIMHINSTFSTLNQLGIGPEFGFAIEDATPTWDAFLGGDARFNSVKTYVYLCVKLLFDPPSTSFAIEAQRNQKQEFEWRLNVLREHFKWVDPFTGVSNSVGTDVIDGGESESQEFAIVDGGNA